MALLNDTGTQGRTFVNIFDTKFEVRVPENTKGSITRENKEGKTITAMHYPGISGHIADLQVKVTEYQGKKFKSLEVLLRDADEKLQLSIPYNSSHLRSFYLMLLNVDLSIPVTFTLGKNKDKNKVVLYMAQEGVNVKWKYTKDYVYAPGEEKLPEWKQVVVRGEEVWDNTEEIQFLEKKVAPIVKRLREEGAAKAAAKAPEQSIPAGFEESDFPTAEPDDPNVGQPPSENDVLDLPF